MAEIVAEGAGIRGGKATKKNGMAEIVAEGAGIRGEKQQRRMEWQKLLLKRLKSGC
jgi:hypothetical protein